MTDPQADKLRAFLQARKQKFVEKEDEKPSTDYSANPIEKTPSSVAVNSENIIDEIPENELIKEQFQPVDQNEPIEHKLSTKNEVLEPVKNSDEREAQLKAFLSQRRSDAKPVEDEGDDPFEGDKIAKKNLRYLTKYLDRADIADIKEIVINRPEEVGLEYADGHWDWIKDIDLTMEQLEDIARTLANSSGQLFHAGNPILSVKMPGGHRVQIVSGFNAPTGFVLSMRLQRKEKFGLKDFTMPEADRERVISLVRDQKTILISGGTGTGKTSYMNALIPSIPDDERLVSMEDVPELRIPHKNWVPLLFSGSDTAMGDQGVLELLNACLRLRPDRIILGEIRKENAFAFCSAINTGHAGSMATIHANTPRMALDAVINRVMMNGDLPDSAIEVLRRQLVNDIYAVVQLTKINKGVKAELVVLSDVENL